MKHLSTAPVTLSHREASLDAPLDEFARQLHACVDLIVERYGTMYTANAHPGIDEATVRGWFDEALPQNGIDVDQLLRKAGETVVAHPVMNIGTKMFAYVMSGGTQVSVMADLLASALNQNAAKWHLAPAMTEIEQRVIAWTAEFLGLPEHRGGAIVASGSAANLTGLTVARNLFAERLGVRTTGLFGLQPLIVYGSDQTHASVEKAVELLGIGSDNYRKIPTRPDFTLDPDTLRQQIERDRDAGLMPFCIVANAGTVNTGAIDPLAALADIASASGLWLHVDGAYGGLASALATHRGAYRGIERADSIALDYHKWLYQPYEVGCTLVRDWDALKRTYHKSAEYLDYGVAAERFDVSRYHFDLSRNTKAFKVWMSFKAYGAQRIADMIAKDIELADYLARCCDDAEDFATLTTGPLAITCFRYIADGTRDDDTLDAWNASLPDALERDGRVFITGTRLHGRPVLRACIINHRFSRPDIDYLIAVIREVAQRIADPD
jgi:glutamate/tyrosine decarboxylase-like PLP-dependent enzyme